MIRVDLKSLSQWRRLEIGELVVFPCSVQRRVRLLLNACGEVDVYASDGPSAVLLASGAGMMDLTYTAKGESSVWIDGGEGSFAFIQTFDGDERVERSGTDSYTRLDPGQRRNTEFDRMMQVVKLNERRRDQQLARELGELRMMRQRLQEEAEAKASAEAEASDAEEVTE